MNKIPFIVALALVLTSCAQTPPTPITPTKQAVPQNTPDKEVETISKVDADFAQFNQQYKQALFWSNQNNPEKTKDFYSKASIAWKAFFATYATNKPDAFAKTSNWDENLLAMQEEFMQAGTSIENNELLESHEHLEKVRITWFAMRTENGMHTFADALFAFHEAMEETLLINELPSYEKHITALVNSANVLETTHPPLNSQDEKLKFTELTNALKQEVEKGQKATQALKDIQEIKEAASGIKPAFTKLYLQFG